MAAKSGSLDSWRNYFRNANSDIFGIIDYAILVAASDCPKEFRLRRDRIAEQLFSCRLTRCLGCDRVELAVAGDIDGDDGETGFKSDFAGDGCEFEAGGSKESKVYSSRDDIGEMNCNRVSNFSFGEAEALTDEIEQESQIVGEVLRIKEILNNFEDESDSVLFESLRRLELMALSVDTLQATEIGKAVNCLRKHGSKRIRHLARVLIMEWKDMVDVWVQATAAVQGAEVTPDSKSKSAAVKEEDDYEEEGLPSPPLDEAAFFTTQPTSMELSQFFDGMDDDGNPRNSGDFVKNRNNVRKTSNGNQNPTRCNQQTTREVNVLSKENKTQMKEQVVKPNNKPSSNTNSGLLRQQKLSTEQKDNHEKFQRKLEKPTIPKRNQQDNFKCSDEVAVQVKLEATKRKLQESYQQAENAKKQRTIQVMELHDLPKQGIGHRNPHLKSGGFNRHWTNGRR
ncbi:putative mediator of RNA polymerase II transcription subunit 26b [Cucumis melo var. makuwa]|uniref:Mediator of RNA polymerase II transcription subunit 26b n=1 Tax=Cucumis melo var. makuwa TaxID=1194695 RepID=A0A5A7UDQ2_CUCMM|nr:putative mediator of RNA polymerase II transcription subunit 26b [Cucumis melo var. makuwa]TYK25493.1 putative mediator of RNA polymerase II transcription subunit 26b [Cucumis melo var. makuwa]